MNMNLNQYEINRQHQQDLYRKARNAQLANSLSTSDSGVNLISAARNSVGNLLTNMGASLQERYAQIPVTAATTGTFSQVEI